MKIDVAFYHGIRHQVRRVLVALGPERVEKGLTAFDDGDSTWTQCFFARAFAGDIRLGVGEDPETQIMNALKIETRVPVRIVWNLFDQYDHYTNHVGGLMSKKDFRSFVEGFLDESRNPEVLNLLRSLDAVSPLSNLSDREVKVSCE